MNYYVKNVILGFILLILLSCNNQWDKKGLGKFKIKRQESYNYSEMLGGELDSTEKAELEQVKKIVAKKTRNTPEKTSPIKDKIESLFDKIGTWLSNLFKNVFD